MRTQSLVRVVGLLLLVLSVGCAAGIPQGTLGAGGAEALEKALSAQHPRSGKPTKDLVELVRGVRRGVVLIEAPQAATFGAYLEELGDACSEAAAEFPGLADFLYVFYALGFGWLETQDVVLQGTGVLVATSEGQGYVLTNAHVLGKRPDGVRLRYEGAGQDGFVEGELLWADRRVDLALLRAPLAGSTAKPLPLATAHPELGRWLLVVGYPVRGDAYNPPDPSITLGVLSSWDVEIEPFQRPPGVLEPPGLLQTEAAINPGNSGGPVLDLSGRVVAIVCSRSTDSDGIGYAIPIQWAIHALARDLKLKVRPYGLTLDGDEETDDASQEDASADDAPEGAGEDETQATPEGKGEGSTEEE